MRNSIFSKFFILYTGVILISFAAVIAFTNYSLRSVLIAEKQTSMQKEGKLIARQYARDYFSGKMTTPRLSRYFQELDSLINAQIWLCDAEGIIVTTSTDDTEYLGLNLFDINPDFEIDKTFRMTGDFHAVFTEEVLSTGRPISLSGELAGYLILHSPLSNLISKRDDLIRVTLVSILILIFVTFLLMSYFSRRILVPIYHMNVAARKYASGNFETTIPVNKKDEIGQLATSLNFMASELSKMDEYRKTFISNVSHDFRSPLTSMKGYLEAMLDGTIPPELYDKYLHIVLAETQRLSKLTSSLTTLKDLNGYGPLLKLSDFNLIDIMNSVIATFEGRCANRGIKLLLTSELSPCMVYGDKTKIEQVIYNLIDNAIKFSHDNSSIKITITENNNEKLSISIKDTGIGIPRTHQSHIWDRFYKADNSRGKDKAGHGIGLAIAKETIAAHKEQINLISTEGVGSEFVFTLTKTKG